MMKSYYYNLDDAEFFNATGEKIPRCVPELYYQERAVWQIFLRDRDNHKRDFDGIVAWSAAVDRDFSSGSAPMCRAVDADISVDDTAGSVTVRLDANTAEFLAAVDGNIGRPAYFELCGLDAEGGRKLCLCFEIRARMAVDPDPAVAPEVHDTLATKIYTALAISGALIDYPTSSGARAVASAVIGSGGYVDSSGAAVIASGAAMSAASGAIFSNAEIKTTVGSYRVALTSGGGMLISGGGVQLQVSSGVIIASGASGESVVLSGGTARLANNYDYICQYIEVSQSGITIAASDPGRDINLNCYPGSVFVNSRPVLTALPTSTDTETTCANFDVLEGGTSYIYTQPLTNLDIASITSDCRAEIDFTAASGAQIGLPSGAGIKLLGLSSLDSGVHYLVAVDGARVVVNSYTVVGE